eukprot:12176379-Karenia_brevis.AAC.1
MILPAKAPTRVQAKSPAPQFGQVPRGGRPDRDASRGPGPSHARFDPRDVVRSLGMTDNAKKDLLR